MKEATGELNTTVVTVILVASIASFFYFTIWPMLQNNLNQSTGCSKAICLEENRHEDGTVDCQIWENGVKKSDIKCVWKG